MVPLRWVQVVLLVLVLQTSALSPYYSSSTVRDGDRVTLSCRNMTQQQHRCDNITWIFSHTWTTKMFENGQIHKDAGVKSDRMSVTENCSLVIERVTFQDAGRYSCRQFGRGEYRDSDNDLYVVSTTTYTTGDALTLICSVWSREQCRHTLTWLLDGTDADERTDKGTVQFPCRATASFRRSRNTPENPEVLQCEVRDESNGEVQLFSFRPPASALNCCSSLDYTMLLMRAAELLLVTVVTALLIRAHWNQRTPGHIALGAR